MDDKSKEIAYDILQYEYLKRRNISISEGNLKKIMNFFPNDWFTCYSLDSRINLISLALKNNIDLELAIQAKIKER